MLALQRTVHILNGGLQGMRQPPKKKLATFSMGLCGF